MCKKVFELYETRIFPALMEWNLSSKKTSRQREEVLSSVNGKILEIGFGTGLNVEHYPDSIKKITAIDINPAMEGFIKKRIKDRELEVEIFNMSAEKLAFEENSFDCIVSTFCLCSIPDVYQALIEFKRVLKPKGRFVFLEHGINPNRFVRSVQNLTNPLFNVFACGCNVNRDIKDIVLNTGFQLEKLEEFNMGRPISGYTYRGIAIKI